MRNLGSIIACLVLIGCGPKWTYGPEAGPARWADLHERNAACAGTMQSPIDLGGAVSRRVPPLRFGGDDLVTVAAVRGRAARRATVQGGRATLRLDGLLYTLAHVDVHAPAEHTVDGRRADAEIHFVFLDVRERPLVVAFFGRADDDGDIALCTALAADGVSTLDLADWRPRNARRYIRYEGSLTTPPCTEGVPWIILPDPRSISAAALTALEDELGPTNRPLQERHGRTVILGTPNAGL